jgi:DNA invertase Pin-like site-specific DNA recombinase
MRKTTTTTTENTTPTAIYVRISQDRTGAGKGVQRQEAECRALAKRQGWTVVDVYSDDDVSAYNGKHRPAYERMLADIGAGRITAVIAWHPDRLHRRSLELERYINLCERHGVANQTVTAGLWDLTTPSGRMTARQLGAVAAYESEHKSERLKAARIQQAAEGKHHGGIRPYGYEKDGVTVIVEEAAEIAAACTAVASGASLRGIVRDMNARGVRTVKGKPWTSQQLRQTLMSPRIAGKSVHGKVKDKNGKDTKVAKVASETAEWPAIVDEETWQHTKAVLSNQKRQTNGGHATGGAKWLGSGTYVCACGKPSLRASRTGSSANPAYRCTNAADHSVSHVTRNAVALDAYVEAKIVERLSQPDVLPQLLARDDTADVAALRAEQASLAERKDQAALMFAAGEIDAAQLAQTTKFFNERAKAIAATLAQTGWHSPLEPLAGGDITALWSGMSMAQKRAALAVLAEVHVVPIPPTTRGFNPAGVRIAWKVG